MGPKSALRRLKILRRLFNTLPADMWATLQKQAIYYVFFTKWATTLIASRPEIGVATLKRSRRAVHLPSSQLCPTLKTHDGKYLKHNIYKKLNFILEMFDSIFAEPPCSRAPNPPACFSQLCVFRAARTTTAHNRYPKKPARS